MKHQLVTAGVALVTVAIAFASGVVYRKPALVGATTSGVAALGSILAMARFARGPAKPMQRALAVMAIFFLVRIVLVAAGTIVVARAGENIFAFVVGFFVPYFVYIAIEAAFLQALGRSMGPTA